jgi:hypothetical protein
VLKVVHEEQHTLLTQVAQQLLLGLASFVEAEADGLSYGGQDGTR